MNTIEGLLASEILELPDSQWNMPILPFENQGTGRYLMAHDLHRINAIVTTATVPVPNPYTAMSALGQNTSGLYV